MSEDATYRWLQEPDEPENIVEPEPDYWAAMVSHMYPIPESKSN